MSGDSTKECKSPRDAQRVCSQKSNGHKTRPSWLSRVPGGSRAVPHATAYDAVHGAFMTLPAYSRSREGERHEPGFGVRNYPHTARSRPVEASRERMERACPGTSAQETAGSRLPWELQTPSGGLHHACQLETR